MGPQDQTQQPQDDQQVAQPVPTEGAPEAPATDATPAVEPAAPEAAPAEEAAPEAAPAPAEGDEAPKTDAAV